SAHVPDAVRLWWAGMRGYVEPLLVAGVGVLLAVGVARLVFGRQEARMPQEDTTYFGLFSGAQRANVITLLEGLRVRYTFQEVRETEERLRAWTAWDDSSSAALVGYELFVNNADLDKLGTKLVELYPERKFEK